MTWVGLRKMRHAKSSQVASPVILSSWLQITHPNRAVYRRLSLAALVTFALLAAFGVRRIARPAGSGTAAERPIVIVGATVIPMTDAPATATSALVRLSNHTVVIRSGRIIAVGPSDSVTIPVDAIRVDARGKFVMPGLVDAHVHLLGQSAANDPPCISRTALRRCVTCTASCTIRRPIEVSWTL